MGDRRRERGTMYKSITMGEVSKRGREAIYKFLIKICKLPSQFEVGESGREAIYKVIKIISKSDASERGWEDSNRLIECCAKFKVGEGGREGFDWLVKTFPKN
jgi:hypothetical protein